ncbi:hypothetical protein BpHYR1_008543 [Brachionus plicatilis]|uniref:Uncharacterized protein n=1 Tax=Brachionus plicatilis TaxID=10195 RepID=A0A3M7T5B6_BRAPC|nr:hypothetical protein BpHYR1_008543 [Brachionus plicatilis]
MPVCKIRGHGRPKNVYSIYVARTSFLALMLIFLRKKRRYRTKRSSRIRRGIEKHVIENFFSVNLFIFNFYKTFHCIFD